MKAFKTHDEVEARRRQFIAEADKSGQLQADIFTFTDLKKLSNDELLDRMEQVSNQADLIKWRIWWELRQRFKSDLQFGRYIQELKADPARAFCVTGKEDISRMHNAGRFCEKHKITSLESIGLLKTAIYELSRPINADVADKVFRDIKKSHLPIEEVRKRIAQAKPVATIEQEPIQQPERIDYTQEPIEKRIIEVVDNVAQIPEVLEHISSDSDNIIQAEEVSVISAVDPVKAWIQEEAFEYDAELMEEIVNPLINYTDEQIADDVIHYVEAKFKRFGIKQVRIYQLAIDKAKPTYQKR